MALVIATAFSLPLDYLTVNLFKKSSAFPFAENTVNPWQTLEKKNCIKVSPRCDTRTGTSSCSLAIAKSLLKSSKLLVMSSTIMVRAICLEVALYPLSRLLLLQSSPTLTDPSVSQRYAVLCPVSRLVLSTNFLYTLGQRLLSANSRGLIANIWTT